MRIEQNSRKMMGWGVIMFSGLLLCLGGNFGGIFAILALVPGSLLLVGADLTHPLTWFLPFYALYGISAPLLHLIGFREITGGQVFGVLSLHWLGGIGFIMGAGTHRYVLKKNIDNIKNLKVPAYVLISVSFCLTGLYMFGVARSGAQSKYDIVLSSDPFLMFYPAFTILLVSYMVLLTTKFGKSRLPFFIVTLAIIWHLLAVLFAGERDLLLRILWVTVMLWHVRQRPVSKRWTLILVVIGIITIPALGSVKNVLLRKNVSQMNLLSFAPEILNDEFYTASSNLALLIYREDEWRPFKYGKTLLWDLQRSILPGTLVRWGPNPGSWFNHTFFPKVVEMGGGQGFTFIGEGYMNFGVFGAWLWLFFLGLSTRWLYYMGSRYIFWQIIYIASMPLFAFITRGDFSVLFAQLIKHLIFPAFAIFITKSILTKLPKFKFSDY